MLGRFLRLFFALFLSQLVIFFLVLFLLAAVAVGLFLSRTPLGIGVHMVGSNPEATRYSGVDVKRVLVGVYGLVSCPDPISPRSSFERRPVTQRPVCLVTRH